MECPSSSTISPNNIENRNIETSIMKQEEKKRKNISYIKKLKNSFLKILF